MSSAHISKLTLFSVLPAQTLLANFDAGFIAEPAEKNEVNSLWQKANAAYCRIGPPTRSFVFPEDLRPIENVDPAKTDRILGRIKFYAPWDSHPTKIYNVRINKLVTPQITINLSRAKKRANVKRQMSPNELFDLAFESGGGAETITRQVIGMQQNGGALLFTSYDEDIRLYHPPQHRKIPINEKDPQSPTFESTCMPVGGGLPFASALRVQIGNGAARLILNNGIHRVYKLAEAGYEWCPLIVSDLIPLEFPDPFVEMPKSILLDANANPPLLVDFLNKNLVIPLEYFTVLKTIRLNWNFEQYVTVLK